MWLEASVVAVRGSVVHGQINVVVMRVDRRVVVVMVVVKMMMLVVVIVQGGQVLQRGHVRGWGQPGHDHLVVYPPLRWTRWVAGMWRHKKWSLHCLRLRGQGVLVRHVFRGRT